MTATRSRRPCKVAVDSSRPNVLLIPGTSSVSHLEENMAVTDIALDDGTRQQLDAVA